MAKKEPNAFGWILLLVIIGVAINTFSGGGYSPRHQQCRSAEYHAGGALAGQAEGCDRLVDTLDGK